jgi:transposase
MLVPSDLDGLLPPDHRARVAWDFVKSLDLSGFYGQVRSVDGHAGRPAIDPAILMALWLYATLEGVGSARALERLCESHDAYRWICGGVGVNYHTLAGFKSERPEELDRILSESVAMLMAEGLVTLERVAQDGVRVRAEAGSASFRRKEPLERLLEEAEGHVAALRREVDDDPQATTRRQKAARERGARERADRVRRALAHREEVAALKKKNGKGEERARASTTDPDARVMKMGDGGYRPAYNGQFASDVKSQVIVGVEATCHGTDMGRLGAMCDQIERRYGRRPREALVDAGFVKYEDIERVAALGTTTYAPVPERRCDPRAPNEEHPADGPAVAEWRRRMGTDDAKRIYLERAATAECVNAQARNRGLRRVFVRGAAKVRATFLWFALAHNCMRAAALRRILPAAG